jgi:hypothetical protein
VATSLCCKTAPGFMFRVFTIALLICFLLDPCLIENYFT